MCSIYLILFLHNLSLIISSHYKRSSLYNEMLELLTWVDLNLIIYEINTLLRNKYNIRTQSNLLDCYKHKIDIKNNVFHLRCIKS